MDGLIIDCFAGGGGASVGIEMALGRHVDIAINHDPEAIRMHKVNHPDTLHLTEDIFKVDLHKYAKGRKVAFMWASPDCTSHSKAKGGQPRKMIDYCKQFNSEAECGNCIFDKIQYPESDETVCTLNFYHICPVDWDKIALPSLDGNTVTYIKDGQIKRITCSRKEEAQELFEEVKNVQK